MKRGNSRPQVITMAGFRLLVIQGKSQFHNWARSAALYCVLFAVVAGSPIIVLAIAILTPKAPAPSFSPEWRATATSEAAIGVRPRALSMKSPRQFLNAQQDIWTNPR